MENDLVTQLINVIVKRVTDDVLKQVNENLDKRLAAIDVGQVATERMASIASDVVADAIRNIDWEQAVNDHIDIGDIASEVQDRIDIDDQVEDIVRNMEFEVSIR